MKEANADDACAGVITCMHTFSPYKMWIQGISILNKPYMHLNTQLNKELPYSSIDMNFMNTNHSAHIDREHGFITARLRILRTKITIGGDDRDGFCKNKRSYFARKSSPWYRVWVYKD